MSNEVRLALALCALAGIAGLVFGVMFALGLLP
mgnify:CR=1 FL=1